MAEKRRPALGRGMAALLSNAAPPPSTTFPTGTSGRMLLSLPVEAVERNPEQPRKRFEEKRLEELAASIREHGIVEPILVRREGAKYRILAGERRWRAAQRAGLKEVPAIVREASEREAFELALVENLQREDLNAIEEAEAYEVLMEDHGLTQEAIAQRVGKERSTVANALRLLKLPGEVRDLVKEGQLDMGHARALLVARRRGDHSEDRPARGPRGALRPGDRGARSSARPKGQAGGGSRRRDDCRPGARPAASAPARSPVQGAPQVRRRRASRGRVHVPRRARRNTREDRGVMRGFGRPQVGGRPVEGSPRREHTDVLLEQAAGGGAGSRRGSARSANEATARGAEAHGHAEAR